MDKNTLSNYGWIVIAVLVLSVMIALATPFGQYIEQGVRATTEGLFSTSQNAMNNAFGDLGVEVKDQTFEEGYKAPNGENQTPTAPSEPTQNASIHNGTIPAGGIYYVGVTTNKTGDYTGATATYTEGEQFPTISDGDIYVYGDYEYRYNWVNIYGNWYNMKTDSDVQSVVNQGLAEYGWSVRVLNDTQTEYGEILLMINNQNIKNLAYTFYDCSNVVIAPEIPETTVCMESTFNACVKLTTAPSKIPENVTNMTGTFAMCWELTGMITIDANPLSYDDCLNTFTKGKPITITGKSTMLNEIAGTNENAGRVTIE